MRVIGPRLHGYLDIFFVIGFILGPVVFGLGGSPLLISVLLGVALLILTLLTRFPRGAAGRTITLTLHGLIELGIAIFVALLPRLGGYSPGSPARSFYWTMAIALGIVWLLTDFREDGLTVRRGMQQKA